MDPDYRYSNIMDDDDEDTDALAEQGLGLDNVLEDGDLAPDDAAALIAKWELRENVKSWEDLEASSSSSSSSSSSGSSSGEGDGQEEDGKSNPVKSMEPVGITIEMPGDP